MSFLVRSSFLIAVLYSTISWSVPSGFHLVSPKQIRIIGQQLVIHLDLPCSNEEAIEWAQVVISNDDSGDLESAVGVVIADSQCKKIPGTTLKTFEINHDLGYVPQQEQTFTPMALSCSGALK